jgi:sugar phosphate isomerase/epimerase
VTDTIHPRVSVNGASTRQWSMAQDLEFWRRHGYRVVGITGAKFATDPEPEVNAIRHDGLQVSCVVIASPFTLGEPDRWAAQHDRVAGILDIAHRLDAGCVYLTTGSSRTGMTVDESIDALCVVLGPVLARARELGVRVAIEPSSPTNHDMGCVHSLRDAIWVADQTGVDLIVDLQTCWLERDLATMVRHNLDRVALVQVSDFVVGTETRLSRAVPGDGDIPLERLLSDILAAGYGGVFDVEVLGRRIVAEGYEQAVPRAVGWLSDCLYRLGA